jgi:LacI family transcriptional regulator
VPCDAITVDRAYGSYLACDHLIKSGGERLAAVVGGKGGRMEGYQRALREHGIEKKRIGRLTGEEPPQEAYEVALKLLKDDPQINGVFCHSDLNALGVMKAIEELGMKIPDDVRVAGYDNEPWAAFHSPALTTVTHPIDQLCSLSLSVLQDRLSGNDEPWCRIGLHPGLVARESSLGPDA